ncbi:MAG: transcriptional antiterminator BglG [Erysipelotrichaceae bacterium]|nr:MAG: transcriptional antiterminator [Erysipelotrichaceae bacterium]TXT19181.1 MAG: transcriptional antiterminator BglG [Erysipelotrichaceae bacterium]
MTQRLAILSPRMIHCLTLLSDSDSFKTVNDLANVCKTSKRTLFREMKDINGILKSYQLSIISKTGLGIKLDGSNDDKLHFKSLLLQISANQGILDKDDRQQALLAELLKNKSLQKLITYANLFQVSEATISNDINGIEPLLNDYKITLIRKPGLNLYCEGNEEDFRKAITDFIYTHMEEDKFTRLISSTKTPWDIEDYFRHQGPDSILNVLNKDILWQVIQVLQDNDTVWANRLAQNSYIGLILHLTIAIERMRNHDPILINEELLNRLKKDPMFDRAKELAEHFEDEFDLNFPMEELAYITMHLKGARLLHIEESPISDVEDVVSPYELQRLVYQLVDYFEDITKSSVKQDDLLISGLITHLRPALTRIKYQLQIRNPLLKQIQTQYSEVYKVSLLATERLGKQNNIAFNEDEIAYLALHFGAALERLNQNKPRRTVNVAVLCASGIGISALLASRIKRLFKEDIHIVPRSQFDLETLHKENFDLLITTMEIKPTKIPVIMVNPLLSDADIEIIKSQVYALAMLPKKISDSVLDQQDNITVIKEISSSLSALIDNVDVVNVKSSLTKDQLLNLVGYRIGKNETQGKQIVADLKAREVMGSVIMDDEGFALFHAKSSGVDQPVMMVFRPDQGFLEAFDSQKIKVVIILLVPPLGETILSRFMSILTSSLLEDELYKAAVFGQDKSILKAEVRKVLNDPFNAWIMGQVKL